MGLKLKGGSALFQWGCAKPGTPQAAMIGSYLRIEYESVYVHVVYLWLSLNMDLAVARIFSDDVNFLDYSRKRIIHPLVCDVKNDTSIQRGIEGMNLIDGHLNPFYQSHANKLLH